MRFLLSHLVISLDISFPNRRKLIFAEKFAPKSFSPINPAHADAQHAIAVVYARQNRLDLAIPHCREALRLNPAFDEARRNLERLLKGQP